MWEDWWPALPSKVYLKTFSLKLGSRFVGFLCLATLRVLTQLPPNFLHSIFHWTIPIYFWIRRKQVQRLRKCFTVSPFSQDLNLLSYYRMRLRLFLIGLRQHGRSLEPGSITVFGDSHYKSALTSGRPVVLLGAHAGLLELLHQVPLAPKGRPFLILTAPAFTDALSKFMAAGRKRDGKDVIWMSAHRYTNPVAGKGLAAGLRLLLKENGVLAMMVDQNPKPELESDFLLLWDKISITYPARLLEFLSNSNCLFVPVSTFLQANGKSVFTFHPPWNPLGRKNVKSSPETLDRINLRTWVRGFMESTISQAPQQWNWSYPKIQAPSI